MEAFSTSAKTTSSLSPWRSPLAFTTYSKNPFAVLCCTHTSLVSEDHTSLKSTVSSAINQFWRSLLVPFELRLKLRRSKTAREGGVESTGDEKLMGPPPSSVLSGKGWPTHELLRTKYFTHCCTAGFNPNILQFCCKASYTSRALYQKDDST